MTYQAASINNVDITSAFWSHVQSCSRERTIPAIIEAQKSWNHWLCLTWKENHEVKPHQFWDSDIYKILEAACYSLMKHPNNSTMKVVEDAVGMIRNAQHDDGYINSYYTVRGLGQRWTNLRDNHELYCIGHLLEAVVAYETLTQSGRLLDVAMKVCMHLDSTFGVEPGKKRGYPGHQEVEVGLLRLYEFTNNPLPLKLARYFILERGQRDENDEIYFDKEAIVRGVDPYEEMGSEHKTWYRHPRDYQYHQADQPLALTTEVKGHSVRAMYYYTAATDLVRLLASTDSQVAELQPALSRLWRDLIDTKLYITGGLGSVTQWEGFGPAHLLPDLESSGCYAETCASFALINWCSRMLRLNLQAEYADVMETALYNGFLGAVNQNGDAFYYQNVLRTTSGHPKERSKWFGVACCPPNVAKLLGSLGSLIYSHDPTLTTVAVHLYIESEFVVDGVRITQTTNMPWDGHVSITIHTPAPSTKPTTLALRIPRWAAETWTCSVPARSVRDGYLYVPIPAASSTVVIELDFPMAPRKTYTNPLTYKDEVCVVRGPLVYCFEDVDNPSVDIDFARLADSSDVVDGPLVEIGGLAGVVAVRGWARGMVRKKDGGKEMGARALYAAEAWRYESSLSEVVAIPYFLRGNREGGLGAMRVWIPRGE